MMLKRAEGMGMRRAMTLIECMVALVILTLSASIMVMAVQGGLAAQEEALSMTLAGTAAESRIAEYLSKSYPTIAVADITEAPGAIKTPTGEFFSYSYNKMSRRTIVTSANLTVPDFPGLIVQGYLFDVTVSDSWQGQDRKLVSLQRFRPWTTEEEGAVTP
ncbi:MAG: type II secretion system protein [Phycisphaerales bacterium]|jgi:prepilin-type N-terminal cleavage/methylation domain-containing protein